MFSPRLVLAATFALAISQLASSQAAKPAPKPAAMLDFQLAGSPLAADPADPRIAAMLKEVQPARIKADIARLVEFNNRSTISSTETDLKPGTGVLAAADWVKSEFDAYSKACGGCLEVSFDESVEQPGPANSRFAKPTPIKSIIAILKGADPKAAKRMVLVAGHYDSRSSDVMDTHSFAPGANDDGSGAALTLEAARVMSKYRFPATIVFAVLTSEEQGLNGARHLAERAKAEGWQLEAVLNNDIVGGDTTPGDKLQSKFRLRVFSQGLDASLPADQIRQIVSIGAENDTPSRQLARQILAVGRSYMPQSIDPVMELRLDRFLRGGDHSAFSRQGFAAVRMTDWRENYDHQHANVRTEGGKEYGDLLKFIDPEYAARVTRLNIATLATLAGSPGTPQRVRVETSSLDNDTLLRWDPPTNFNQPVRYQIVWRETAANDWQYSAEAAKYSGPSENSARLPISKDNVFFGVRACTAQGACSQAVAPVPGRD